MSDTVTFQIDGKQVTGRKGQTIMEAADEEGIYIPRLCRYEGIKALGSCRVCTVVCNGRPQASCTQPIAEGMQVEHETEEVQQVRKDIIDMLFVEGNHFCMFCEKSGNCELQAVAYRFGITGPKYTYLYPQRDLDGTHPDIFIDRNRCILCGRCVHASKTLDGKNVFQFVERGAKRTLAVNADAGLEATDAKGTDKAIDSCPVGALVHKHVGFAVPIGKRTYDKAPIGSEVENHE